MLSFKVSLRRVLHDVFSFHSQFYGNRTKALVWAINQQLARSDCVFTGSYGDGNVSRFS